MRELTDHGKTGSYGIWQPNIKSQEVTDPSEKVKNLAQIAQSEAGLKSINYGKASVSMQFNCIGKVYEVVLLNS